ncbi:hypothetical protein OAP83_01100 [Rickettsiales bacterium]|jgi:hypothetical protein|nr:hypothetical protein [Rickettsiales bacterium]
MRNYFFVFIASVFTLGNSFASNITVDFDYNSKLRFDTVRDYTDGDSSTDDASYDRGLLMLELYPNLDFNLQEGVSIQTSWVYQLLKTPHEENDLQGEGLVLNELFLNFENEDAAFFIGKINPDFSIMWDHNINSGIWTSDIAETYKITGKIGLGGKIKFVLENFGQHDFSIATFYYDDSNLSESLFTKRGISDSNIGLASETGSLSSFSLNLGSKDLDVFDGFFYNLSYRFLNNSSFLNIEDEEGYSVGFGLKYNILNNITLRPLLEYVDIENFNSFNNDFNQEFGDDDYLPADYESKLISLNLDYKRWSFNYMKSKQNFANLSTAENIDLDNEGFSASYAFENNLSIRAGSIKTKKSSNGMSKKTISVQLLYKNDF